MTNDRGLRNVNISGVSRGEPAKEVVKIRERWGENQETVFVWKPREGPVMAEGPVLQQTNRRTVRTAHRDQGLSWD